MTMKRSGGRILTDNLLAQGCDRIFHVPGESFLAVLDALQTLDDDGELRESSSSTTAARLVDLRHNMSREANMRRVKSGGAIAEMAIGAVGRGAAAAVSSLMGQRVS